MPQFLLEDIHAPLLEMPSLANFGTMLKQHKYLVWSQGKMVCTVCEEAAAKDPKKYGSLWASGYILHYSK